MSRSLDRYLYAIRTLKEKYLCVRAVDVAHYLGLSKASVSIALRQLREQGLIEAEPDGNLLFTPLGRERVDLLTGRVAFFQQILTGSNAGFYDGMMTYSTVLGKADCRLVFAASNKGDRPWPEKIRTTRRNP